MNKTLKHGDLVLFGSRRQGYVVVQVSGALVLVDILTFVDEFDKGIDFSIDAEAFLKIVNKNGYDFVLVDAQVSDEDVFEKLEGYTNSFGWLTGGSRNVCVLDKNISSKWKVIGGNV